MFFQANLGEQMNCCTDITAFWERSEYFVAILLGRLTKPPRSGGGKYIHLSGLGILVPMAA
tara:strand:- start:153 stop:335 length:183 start_codon:yes stop_codon:yes gene_type:complete